MSGARPAKGRLPASERRNLILTAAREVFVESGFSGARTREIAARADVNEALLYRHFPSKDVLFDEAILAPLETWLQEQPDRAATIAEVDSDASRRHLAQVSHEELIRASVEILPLLGVVLFASGEHGKAFYNDRFLPFHDAWVAAVARSLEGWTRPGLDPVVITNMVFGTYIVYAMDRHFRGEAVDVEHVAGQMVALIFEGLTYRPRATKAAKAAKAAKAVKAAKAPAPAEAATKAADQRTKVAAAGRAAPARSRKRPGAVGPSR